MPVAAGIGTAGRRSGRRATIGAKGVEEVFTCNLAIPTSRNIWRLTGGSYPIILIYGSITVVVFAVANFENSVANGDIHIIAISGEGRSIIVFRFTEAACIARQPHSIQVFILKVERASEGILFVGLSVTVVVDTVADFRDGGTAIRGAG